ncbi:hypothetical protein RBB78_06200 [Tunturiibacter empetritectus]
MAGLNPETLYNFLKCAVPFEGTRNYAEKITELMIKSNVLTNNLRNEKADAWRDYQQLLAELGLIYSTLIHKTLTLTELAHMFLAGEIGFSELIGIQALRYQYPNGQKSTIQARLSRQLSDAQVKRPKTLTELQSASGVLLKPGLLVLKVLIELLESHHQPALSISECLAFLIPCKVNAEWDMAVSEVISHRRTGGEISEVNEHSRRNLQDWFKLLGASDFFVANDDEHIALSSFAIENMDLVRSYCASQEDLSTFWIPTSFDISGRLTWFDRFGHLPLDAQGALRRDLDAQPKYVEQNYVAGLDDDVEEEVRPSGGLAMNLSPIDLDYLERETTFQSSQDVETLLANIRRGFQKRHAKTLLHDRVVKSLAERFIAQGATVESDPDSIDLFALWPTGETAIFEVKTVTQRNLQQRMRTAIGQVAEYAYRRKCSTGSLSDSVIVVNAELDQNAWQPAFLSEYLKIGLICTAPKSYSAFAPQQARSKAYWS